MATAHGWTDDTCPKCPPALEPDHPHPLAVAFAWWPDYPEAHLDARHVYTATCGCGWSGAAKTTAADGGAIPAGAWCRRGVVPPGPGPAELCSCPCHAGPEDETDSCQHCGASIGHIGRCQPGASRGTHPRKPAAQPTLF